MTGPAGRPLHRLSPRFILLALIFFVAMTILQTWPLAQRPGTWSRHDNSDAMLNEWTIAWIAHQLPRDPLHLFDSNIFYPERHSLAFSEHMFPQALMGAPLLWGGAPTLLVHNLLMMAGLALTGWTMCLVMFRWTGDVGAAGVAGLLLAFNAHTLTRLTHLQAMHLEFLPLAMYALDRLLAHPRAATAAGLGVAIALQSLTSNYLLVAMAFGIVAAVAVRPSEWIGRQRMGAFVMLAAAAAVAIVLIVPFLLPYLEARNEQGLVRPLDVVSLYDASWRDYLTTGGRLHFDTWNAPFWRASNAALFPGVVAALLAAVTVITGRVWRDTTARLWLALGLAGLVLSFGTKLPGYSVLYQALPLLQGVRAMVRLGYLVLVAVAALAGFGLARLNESAWLGSPARRALLSSAAIVLVSLEATRVPLGFVPKYTVPTAYRVLGQQRDGAVVELPLPEKNAFAANAPYMLNSTVGWWPLVNGYSGFAPPRYTTWVTDLAPFPSDSAIAALRDGGVRYVVIHRQQFAAQHPGALERVTASPALRQMLSDGDIDIYRVEVPLR